MRVACFVAVLLLCQSVYAQVPSLIGGGGDPTIDLPGPFGPVGGVPNPVAPSSPAVPGSPVAPAGPLQAPVAPPVAIVNAPLSSGISVDIAASNVVLSENVVALPGTNSSDMGTVTPLSSTGGSGVSGVGSSALTASQSWFNTLEISQYNPVATLEPSRLLGFSGSGNGVSKQLDLSSWGGGSVAGSVQIPLPLPGDEGFQVAYNFAPWLDHSGTDFGGMAGVLEVGVTAFRALLAGVIVFKFCMCIYRDLSVF